MVNSSLALRRFDRTLRLARLWLLCIAAIATPATANDSSAVLGAGGLVLTENDAVALEREDLTISSSEIYVRYVFRNVTDKDVATTIAFPLPDIDLGQLAETPIERASADPVNFVDFTVSVDGKPVTPTLQRRAWFRDQDVTDELLARNLKLSFFEPGFYDALWALPKPERQALHARELVFFEEDYHNLYAQWLLRTAFHWQQTFPAGKTVIVEHRYKPVVGQFFVSKWGLPGAEDNSGDADELGAYCLDEGTVGAMRKRIKARSTTAEEEGLLIARAVDYILTTANNWRGPIGTFRLTLDKEDPKRLLSVCLDGLKKTAPTTFVAEYTDYVPKSDLHILILE
jgi:hypothetical protein